MTPLSAATVLDASFLEARGRLLDLAAILDRMDRGEDFETVAADPRLEQIRRALDVLRQPAPGRAERVQRVFSRDYDPGWERPTPG